MKTPAIRIMLDHLCEVATTQEIDLLTVPTYGFVCRTVEAYDRGEKIALREKVECAEDLETLCFALGVNYAWLVHKALIDTGFYDEK